MFDSAEKSLHLSRQEDFHALEPTARYMDPTAPVDLKHRPQMKFRETSSPFVDMRQCGTVNVLARKLLDVHPKCQYNTTFLGSCKGVDPTLWLDHERGTNEEFGVENGYFRNRRLSMWTTVCLGMPFRRGTIFRVRDITSVRVRCSRFVLHL